MADSILTGIITNKGREVQAKRFGIIGTGVPVNTARAFKFKIGEGGFIDIPAGRRPKDPNDGVGYTDIEAASDPSLFYIEKALISTDFTFIAPSTMQVRCRLLEVEGNDDGTGDEPRFFEIGIFDDEENLIVYSTFAEQTKNAGKILNNLVQVVF
jgi:hypothetical protein